MSTEPRQDPLAVLLKDLDETAALAVARERLRAGEDPAALMQACQEGMLEVGLLYEQGRYYLSGLIMAGEILRGITELLKPVLEEKTTRGESGVVLLGTVQGDIHDIGKNMVGMLLRCGGFTVHDLGVDVPPGAFLERASSLRPDVVGMSGLLTVAYDAMRDTLRALRASQDPEVRGLPVVIGGSLITDGVARYVGTDLWARDAMSGLRICQRLKAPASPLPPAGQR